MLILTEAKAKHSGPWELATETVTFSASSWASILSNSAFITISLAIAAVCSLSHFCYLLPGSTKGRFLLLSFALVPVVPIFTRARFSAGQQMATDHPVEALRKFYSAKFDAILAGQSTTLEAANAEYERRYHRKPPNGFDKWFEYARNRQSPIIDEFDNINASLEPWWRYSGAELCSNLDAAWHTDGSHLSSFRIADSEFDTDSSGWVGEQIVSALGSAADFPNVQIAINELDEPSSSFLRPSFIPTAWCRSSLKRSPQHLQTFFTQA